MFEKKRDKIKFINPTTNEVEIINYRTFLMLIYGILTHYLRYSDKMAQNIIKNSPLYEKPENSEHASLRTHESVYHWAMLLAHGNEYWNNGFTSDEPDDFDTWYDKYIEHNNLAEYIWE